MEAIDPAAVALPDWYQPNAGRAADPAMVIVSQADGGGLRAAHVSHRRWALPALGAAAACTLYPRTMYRCLPLHHPAGLLVSARRRGRPAARLSLATRFDPDVFWSEVRSYGATVVFYAGEMGRELLRAPATPAERNTPLRLFAGSGMRADAWRPQPSAPAWRARFYAATEGALVLANAAGDKVGALGRPLPGSSEVALFVRRLRRGRPRARPRRPRAARGRRRAWRARRPPRQRPRRDFEGDPRGARRPRSGRRVARHGRPRAPRPRRRLLVRRPHHRRDPHRGRPRAEPAHRGRALRRPRGRARRGLRRPRPRRAARRRPRSPRRRRRPARRRNTRPPRRRSPTQPSPRTSLPPCSRASSTCAPPPHDGGLSPAENSPPAGAQPLSPSPTPASPACEGGAASPGRTHALARRRATRIRHAIRPDEATPGPAWRPWTPVPGGVRLEGERMVPTTPTEQRTMPSSWPSSQNGQHHHRRPPPAPALPPQDATLPPARVTRPPRGLPRRPPPRIRNGRRPRRIAAAPTTSPSRTSSPLALYGAWVDVAPYGRVCSWPTRRPATTSGPTRPTDRGPRTTTAPGSSRASTRRSGAGPPTTTAAGSTRRRIGSGCRARSGRPRGSSSAAAAATSAGRRWARRAWVVPEDRWVFVDHAASLIPPCSRTASRRSASTSPS